MRLENKAIMISSIVAFSLMTTKIVVGFFSGSLAIVSSGLDSFFDMLISFFNFFVLKKSQSDYNTKHNYGYGKLQGLGALVQGVIIMISSGFIFYSAIQKIINHQGVDDISSGIYVIIFAVIVGFSLVSYLNHVYQKTGNIIIKADIIHYKADFLVNLGVLGALFFIKFWGYEIIDPIISMFIAGYVFYGAGHIFKEGLDMLLDRALSADLVNQIISIIKNTDKRVLSYHMLRTRKSGDHSFVEFHIVLPDDIHLKDAHKIGDSMEHQLAKILPGVVVTIRFDSESCIDCECMGTK